MKTFKTDKQLHFLPETLPGNKSASHTKVLRVAVTCELSDGIVSEVFPPVDPVRLYLAHVNEKEERPKTSLTRYAPCSKIPVSAACLALPSNVIHVIDFEKRSCAVREVKDSRRKKIVLFFNRPL